MVYTDEEHKQLSSSASNWNYEELLTDAEVYATSLEAGIKRAQHSVNFETYIYNDDFFGRRIEAALMEASLQGANVRVVVDGIGSRGWINTVGKRLSDQGIKVKIYHPLFWEYISSKDRQPNSSWLDLLKTINRRNHRKLCTVDGKTAWVSSINISDDCLKSVNGRLAWRELGIKIQGEDVKFLSAAFELIWYPRFSSNNDLRKKARIVIRGSVNSLVRLNSTFHLRRENFRDLIERLNCAKKRIWITNPYFVPTRGFINSLTQAAQRGVDVRVITTAQSDVIFMPWISAVFQEVMVRRGVKVSAYQPSILHAKSLIIDEIAIVGSSNLNRRSLYHDLEVDIVTQNANTVDKLTESFFRDLKLSVDLSAIDFETRPMWQKVFARVILLFQNLL